MTSPEVPRKPPLVALQYCLLNWLIPGAGYFACGDRKRGAALFGLINGCFAVGLLFGAYMVVPAWNPQRPDFNLVTLLTYIVQSFHGGGWLLLQLLHKLAGENEAALFNVHRQAIRTFSDLGIFHIVVAGGLNYFATVRLYDLMAGIPEIPTKTKEKTQPEEQKG